MYKIQQIFNQHTPSKIPIHHKKAFDAIRRCRTPELGVNVTKCKHCDNVNILYHSCRNRHCPICQNAKQHEWVEKQLSKLLPVGYFHLVFTLPQELNCIILQNQELFYSILMKCAADTIKELSADPKYLGAQIGMTCVLHTWGQNLSFHPHLHCIVPGGGLSEDGLRFIKSRKKFFIPVKIISAKFRGKFLYHLKRAWNNGDIKLFNDTLELANGNNFQDFIDELYEKDWVIFCKKPFKTPSHVVRYLGRYTHRVAISDSRILEFDNTNVTFKYKDYKNNNITKTMTVSIEEFIRRFLLHILPFGFTKIRHYGLLSSRNLSSKLLICLKLCNKKPMVFEYKKPDVFCLACGCVLEISKSSISKTTETSIANDLTPT